MFQVLLSAHEPHILPTIRMLVRALELQGVPCRTSPRHKKFFRILARLTALSKIKRIPGFRTREPVFVQINNAWPRDLFPYFLRHPLVTYSFDLWPHLWDRWQEVFEYSRPRIAFISAKVPLEEMKRRVPGIDFRWLPEAVDPDGFDASLPLVSRPVDILEVGRAYAAFHEKLRPTLAASKVNHRFPPTGRAAPVPYEEVVLDYSRAKVCVVFPRSVSHPEQARGTETTTFRYFECMASKTLMIGHCPAELKELFGYSPVIEADFENPAAQILNDILPRIGEHQAFVDRNHAALCATWTVHHQARVIRSAMDELVAE